MSLIKIRCAILVAAIGFFINHSFAQTDANQKIRGLCIYIDYPDVPANVTHDELDSLLNSMTYEEQNIDRSLRKYWYDQSKRNVDIEHDIFFYRAPNPAGYYATIGWIESIGLWREAMEYIITEHPEYDWDQLSTWSLTDPLDQFNPTDGAGSIKGINIISSSPDPAGVGGAHYPNWTLSNGAYISRIQGSMLKWNNADPNRTLFILAHETGHSMFNYPDTYDYESGGTSIYSIMAGRGPLCENVGAPFQVERNWGHILEPETGTHTITLRADGDSLVVFRNVHDHHEFFTIEARKQSTKGNAEFPTNIGLLLWHSDNKVHTANFDHFMTPNNHYRHSIEQPDGLFELESTVNPTTVNAGDIFLPGNSFSDETTPNSKWWAGEASNFELYDIEIVDENHMRFTVKIPEIHEGHHDEIPSDDWAVLEASESSFGHEIALAFDDDVSTYYHVPNNSVAPRPHIVELDLGKEYVLSEFYYQAHDNFTPPWEGRIQEFFLQVSDNGITWGGPIVIQKYYYTEKKQYSLFDPIRARYVKLSAMNTYFDYEQTTIAELDFRGIDAALSDEETVSFIPLQLYPNPIEDELFIKGEQLKEVQIYTQSGFLIEQKRLNENNSIDVSNLNAGIYFIKAKTSNGVEVLKFVKIL